MTLVHLAARAIREAPAMPASEHLNIHNSPAIPIVVVTTLIFFALAAAVRYTYGELIATLAFVESPATTLITSTPPPPSPTSKTSLLDDKTDDEPDFPPPPYEQELLLVRSRPITSSLRGTVRHLKAQSTSRLAARFRGLPLHVLHAAAVHVAAAVLVGLFGRGLVARALAHVGAAVATAPVLLAWVHHVLVAPATPRRGLRALADLTRPNVKRVLGPAALLAVAEQATIVAPLALAHCIGLAGPGAHRAAAEYPGVAAAKLAAVAGVALGVALLVAFPARAVFVRVAASTLAADADTVIPFDHSFGGRVGADGRLSVWNAWRSFDWNARVRVLGVYAKLVAIQIALAVLYVAVVAMEVRLIVGKEVTRDLMVMMKA